MRIPSVEPRGTQTQDAAPSAGAGARDRSLMARAERTVVVPETARPVESTGGASAQVSISEQARRMAEKSLERALTMVEGPKARDLTRDPVAGGGQVALPGKSGVGALRSKLVNALFERVQGKDTTTPPQTPSDAPTDASQVEESQGSAVAREATEERAAESNTPESSTQSASAPAAEEPTDAAAQARAQQEVAEAERAREEAAAAAQRREASLQSEQGESEEPTDGVSLSRDEDPTATRSLGVGFGGDEATGEAREAEIGFASGAPAPRERPARTDEDRDESGTNEPSARPTEPERSKRDAAALPDDPSAPVASTSEPEQATEDATQESTVQRPEDASRAAPAVARRAAAYSADVATQRATAETQIRLVV